MHLSTSFVLLILGVTSQFTCGFSLNPHNSLKDMHQHSLKYPILAVKGGKQLSNLLTTKPFVKRARNARDSVLLRGGANEDNDSSSSITNSVASFWAAGGVIMVLAKSIKRILPIALEPFNGVVTPLSQVQLISYIGMCLWFAYVEGYKGFQLKFSPLVVKRSQSLKPFSGSPIHHILLGPFYAMGLFHATKKRKIISWSVTIGVAVIVAAVKRLPYPWRNIIDAGVIVGLSWGSLSIAIQWFKAVVLGIDLDIDPALPEAKSI